MTEHLQWETLNDYADGRLDAADRQGAGAHLDSCPECRDTLAELRCLLAAASDVPETLDPPAGLWGDVRAKLDARRQGALPSDATRRPPRWATPRRMAAAAVVLMFASSGVTALMLRGGSDDTVPSAATAERPAALPAAFTATEQSFLESVEELQSLLDAQRDRLSPSTLSTVQRSLTTIDDAIHEARAALLDDPANRELVDLLSQNYRHKLELLRRATQLEARS